MLSRFTLAITVFCIVLVAQNSFSAGNGRQLEKTFSRLHELTAKMAEKEQAPSDVDTAPAKVAEVVSDQEEVKWEQATFGNGCFWCTEAVFEELHGVKDVVSGYTGGRVPNPTYRQVCTGLTGHAEVIHLKYNPDLISFGKLLEVFFRTHDPTTLNRQGPDVGTQYRSAVFFHSKEQERTAKLFKSELNKDKAFRSPVVTEVTKFDKFYVAENYHQDYFELHGRAPYCQQMIRPKLTKFRRTFREDLAAVAEKKKKQAAKNEKGK